MLPYGECDEPEVIWLNRAWPGYLGAAVMVCFAIHSMLRAITPRPTDLPAFAASLAILHVGIAVCIFLPTHYDCVVAKHEGITIRRFLLVMTIRKMSWGNITGVVWYGATRPWRGTWDLAYVSESGQSKTAFLYAHSQRSYERVQHLTGAIIQRCALAEKTGPHIPWWHLWRPRPKRIWR